MIELNDDKTLFFFDRSLEPVLTVPSGETVRIRTKDCFSNQLTCPQDQMNDIDWDAVNPATGPVYVEGAVAGGALKVHIDNIEFDEQTCSCTGKDEGPCGDRFEDWATHYCKVQGNTLVWDERLNIPLRPMIGVIGTAPRAGAIHCAVPEDHGGNLDTKLIAPGCTVYLPVFVPGAGLAVADLHACMGDGELSGTGLEIAGRVRLKVSVLRDRPLARPVVENDSGLWFLASRPTLEESLRLACEDGAAFLMERFSLDFPDVYRLMSAACDAQISEVVDQNVTVRLHCPKFDPRVAF